MATVESLTVDEARAVLRDERPRRRGAADAPCNALFPGAGLAEDQDMAAPACDEPEPAPNLGRGRRCPRKRLALVVVVVDDGPGAEREQGIADAHDGAARELD